MAQSKTDESAVAEPIEEQEPIYSLDELSAHAVTLFGVGPEVLAGAMHGRSSLLLTVSEAKKYIQSFLKRKVTS